jgi:hypothetical protein
LDCKTIIPDLAFNFGTCSSHEPVLPLQLEAETEERPFFYSQTRPAEVSPVDEEPNRFIGSAPMSCSFAGFAYMLDIRDPEIGVFTTSSFMLFFFFVLFAHLRACDDDFVPQVLGEIDATALVEAIALSVLAGNGVLASFIPFLQAASDSHAFSTFRFRLIFLCCPRK